jgi:hypothetical protein
MLAALCVCDVQQASTSCGTIYAQQRQRSTCYGSVTERWSRLNGTDEDTALFTAKVSVVTIARTVTFYMLQHRCPTSLVTSTLSQRDLADVKLRYCKHKYTHIHIYIYMANGYRTTYDAHVTALCSTDSLVARSDHCCTAV